MNISIACWPYFSMCASMRMYLREILTNLHIDYHTTLHAKWHTPNKFVKFCRNFCVNITIDTNLHRDIWSPIRAGTKKTNSQIHIRWRTIWSQFQRFHANSWNIHSGRSQSSTTEMLDQNQNSPTKNKKLKKWKKMRSAMYDNIFLWHCLTSRHHKKFLPYLFSDR